MYPYAWYHWLTFFYIYCFIGWIFESTYVSIKSRTWINRGFLHLPMLPLYGFGAVLMLWISIPLQQQPVLLYFVGVIATTLLEYVTGYTMERLFKMKYWDYSNQKLHFRGYICLSSSIAWGFLTLIMTYIIHNPIASFVLKLHPILESILLLIITIVFAIDIVQSIQTALDLGQILETMTNLKADLDHTQVQLALLKAEASQKAGEIKQEAKQKLHDLKEEKEIQLLERMASLSEKYYKLTEQRSPHHARLRKRLLQSNPSASSKRFTNALKELRDSFREQQ